MLTHPVSRASATISGLATDGIPPDSYLASLKNNFARTSSCIYSMTSYLASLATSSETPKGALAWPFEAAGEANRDSLTASDSATAARFSSIRGTALSLLLARAKEA